MLNLQDDEKPREKALRHGIKVLSDTELLAILLRVGVEGRSVLEVCNDILDHFHQNLDALAKASPRELQTIVKGIGPAKALTITAALELGQRVRQSAARQKPLMASSEAIYDFIRDQVEDLDHEEFWLLMLNRRLGVEAVERISSGGMASTVVDVRMIIKRALDARAVAMALVHNHPSNNLNPSQQDDAITRRIKSACELFEIRLIDHVIVGPGGYYSYSDRGKL